MLKRIKIIDEATKQVLTMSANSNEVWAVENAYSADLHEVEKAYNGLYYLKGFAPLKPEPTYVELRLSEYPAISEQLDMIYHNFDNWKSVITEIKNKYPKA
ncbi:MAG: hypothetical protein R3Y43_02660 [Alphaproteobacteria bacterium]